MKRRIVQVSSSKRSIKKDMLFSLGHIEIILVGQGGNPPPLPPLATRLICCFIFIRKRQVCKFLKKWTNFYLILLFPNFYVNKLPISDVLRSQNVKVVLM